MNHILIAWSVLCFIFLGVPILHYLHMRYVGSRPWRLRIDKTYRPYVTILIPVYNEEETIGLKLENLLKVEYPKDRIQTILINDASTDGTMEKISSFVENHPEMNIKILNRTERSGKSKALNSALAYAKGEIIVVTDADCFWSTDILVKTMPYLVDPSVGAVISREVLLNPDETWITRTEEFYFDLVYGTLRLGEAKIHSTITFHGGFSAYNRSILDKFDLETDDSGTALNIVQKGARTIIVPEATSFTLEFVTWKAKFSIKIRRAAQLIRIWTRSLSLLLKRQLSLPLRIAAPQIFLFLFNPLVLLALICITPFLLLKYPTFVLFSLLFIPVLLIRKTRTIFLEVAQNNLILLIALFTSMIRKTPTIWGTLQEPRTLVSREMLERRNLI